MGRLLSSLTIIFAVTFVSTIVFGWPSTSIPKQVLLVSDIDDTIKVSHILNNGIKVARASDITTPFAGMSQLYQLIVNTDPSMTQVVYLSNAPDNYKNIPIPIGFSHENFLKFNDFPKGELLLRQRYDDVNHKRDTIRKLLKEKHYDLVILIGDNGERDPEIYQQIVSENKNSQTEFHSYIHLVYASKPQHRFIPNRFEQIGQTIFADQIGYATPVEIALDLHEKGLLSQESLNWMLNYVVPYIVDEDQFKWDGLKPIAFPFFKNCSDFKWRWSESAEVQPLIQKLKSQCN